MNTKHLNDMTRNGGYKKNGWKVYCNSCTKLLLLSVCTKDAETKLPTHTKYNHSHSLSTAWNKTGRLSQLFIQIDLLLSSAHVICSGNI